MSNREQRSAGAVITDLSAYLQGGGQKTIGAFCFWSLSGVKVLRTEFRAAFEAIGMGAAVSRDPRFETTLGVAAAALPVGKKDVVTRRHDGGFAILVETDVDGRMGLKQVAHVTVEKDKWRVEDARKKDLNRLAPELVWKFMGTTKLLERAKVLARELEQAFAESRSYVDTSDLSNTLVNAMHGTTKDALLQAVSLRQTTGGLYFLHSSKVEQARALVAMVQQLAPKCVVTVMTVTGDHDNLEAAALAARTSFTSQLGELKAELRKFRLETPIGERSERSVSTRLNHFKQLRGRVELFRDVLGSIAGELAQEIDEGRAEVERLLDEA